MAAAHPSVCQASDASIQPSATAFLLPCRAYLAYHLSLVADAAALQGVDVAEVGFVVAVAAFVAVVADVAAANPCGHVVVEVEGHHA